MYVTHWTSFTHVTGSCVGTRILWQLAPPRVLGEGHLWLHHWPCYWPICQDQEETCKAAQRRVIKKRRRLGLWVESAIEVLYETARLVHDLLVPHHGSSPVVFLVGAHHMWLHSVLTLNVTVTCFNLFFVGSGWRFSSVSHLVEWLTVWWRSHVRLGLLFLCRMMIWSRIRLLWVAAPE